MSLTNFQVNNRDVDLERNGFEGGSVCYTTDNPFHVKLLENDKNRENKQPPLLSKKRQKSPTKKPPTKGGDANKTRRDKSPSASSGSRKSGSSGVSAPGNCKFSVKLGKVSSGIRLSPESKRRRRSQYAEPVNSSSAG